MQKIFKPGDKVNGYTVIDYNDETKKYEFVCDECGTKKIGYYYHLLQVCTHAIDITYNALGHTLRSMKTRCYNPKCDHYKDYGGRGITVCDEWLKCAKSFQEWSLENGWKPGLQLDRINNNLGYEPNNCRWVSFTVNQNNKRSNVFLEVDGIRQTVSDWSRILNIKSGTMFAYMTKHGEQATIERIHKGWPRYARSSKLLTINGITLNYEEWSQRLGKHKGYVSQLIYKHGKEKAIHIIMTYLDNTYVVRRNFNIPLITIQGITDTITGWSKRVGYGEGTFHGLIRRLGREKAIQRISDRWNAILEGKEIKKHGPIQITIDKITDSLRGWSRRIGRYENYFHKLIDRYDKEEAIRRVTEQWEAIKKNESSS